MIADDIPVLGTDTPERVCFYERDYYVLSNFSAFKLKWENLVFDTAEAAYHWEKFHGYSDIQGSILRASSAHDAYKIAEVHAEKKRSDWDQVKVSIMLRILRAKAYQHEYVRRKLLATGDRELIEDSWRDSFWGWGKDRNGKNMLGKLWMQVRNEFRLIQESR